MSDDPSVLCAAYVGGGLLAGVLDIKAMLTTGWLPLIHITNY